MSTPDTLVASGTNAASVQAAGDQLAGTQNAVASASGQSMPGMGNETGTVNSGSPPVGSPAAAQAAVKPSDLTGVTPPGADAYKDVPGAQQPAQQGFLGKAVDVLNSKGGAAAITAGGSLLSGVGQGIAQKQATEDAIRASQWANNRWTTPGLSNQAIAASQGNINVPQGYLQRAQAIRSMTANSGVPWQGPVPPQALPGGPGGVPPVPGPVHP
jgi:hypothetical protein